MFGNRYVNYGGPGGVRRGLIWQSSDVGADPCEVSKEWPEWTNPGFFDLELAAKLAFKALTYDIYKEKVERDTEGLMNEASYNSLKDAELERCLQYIRDHVDQGQYSGAGRVNVSFHWWRPLWSWGFEFLWSAARSAQYEVKGNYSTLSGGNISLKGNDTTEHRYMRQYVHHQWLVGYPPYVWGEDFSDDTDDGYNHNPWIYTGLTGYNGYNGSVHQPSEIPNCIVSPCPISHWVGNDVDIHH